MMASSNQELKFFDAAVPPSFREQMHADIEKSIVSTNVKSIFDAQVIGILGDRRKFLFQRDVLNYLKFDDALDHLLVEVGSDVPQSRIKEIFFNFPLKEQCFHGWDSPKTDLYYKRYKAIKIPIQRAVNKISSQRGDYRGWSSSMSQVAAAGNLAHPDNPVDTHELLDTLIYGSDNEVAELKKSLIGRARKWMEDYTGEFIRRIFPIRQKALIDSLYISSLNASRTLFLAGASHADLNASPFSKEIQKLYTFLEKNTFMILNPDRLDPCKYND